MRLTLPAFLLFAAYLSIGNAAVKAQTAAGQLQPVKVDIAEYVAEAAQRFGIPESWIYAVMRTESAGRIGAVSSAGAMGLMQLMPGTWQRQRGRYGLGSDPFDPRDNILAGTSYMREMVDSYGAPGFLAAYNAGPGRYEDWLLKGRPLPAETRDYVARIAPMLRAGGVPNVVASASPVQTFRSNWTQGPLFMARGNSSTEAADAIPAVPLPAAEPALPVPANDLFAPVSGRGRQ